MTTSAGTMSVTVPDTLAATLEAGMLTMLDEALGPARANRAQRRLEVEVEAKGEGTYTLVYDNGTLSARKGFAKGDPMLSAELPRGGWALVRRALQTSVDGYPAAPEIARRRAAVLALPAAEWERMLDALEKVKDLAVAVELKGAGRYRVARGALDEATRELTLTADAALVEQLLSGGNVNDVAGVKLSGDRGLAAELLKVFGPLAAALKR